MICKNIDIRKMESYNKRAEKIGYTWARFIVIHMNIPFTDIRGKIYGIVGLVACILLMINIFYPLVFSNKDGVYQRGPAYSVFLLFAVFYMLDSLFFLIRLQVAVIMRSQKFWIKRRKQIYFSGNISCWQRIII